MNTNTTIESVYGIDMLSSEVVGLIGAPVEIKSSLQFDEATLTFNSYGTVRQGFTDDKDILKTAVNTVHSKSNGWHILLCSNGSSTWSVTWVI